MMDEADRTRYRQIEEYKERSEALHRAMEATRSSLNATDPALAAERRAEREQQEAEHRFLAAQAEKRAKARDTKTALISTLDEQVRR